MAVTTNSSVKEDDANLMAMAASSREIIRMQGKSTASSTASNTNANTDSLARSNMLRLEASELLKESILHIHPATSSSSSSSMGHPYFIGGNAAHEEVKWAPMVRDYLSKIKEVIASLNEATLSPNVALLPPDNDQGDDNNSTKTMMYRIPLLSDKFHKSLPFVSSGKPGEQTSNKDNNPHPWSFPFHGGSSLSLVPIGSFGHIGNAGLANRHANGGNVLPVLDVAVLVDNNSDASSPFVSGKDYLNHRYTDKRNILAVHIAKQLSQKKYRNKIGAVHLTNVLGDARKVGLLLTPPRMDAGDEGKGNNKKKRQRTNNNVNSSINGGGKMQKKLRFRIRLIFGIKPTREQQLNEHTDSYNQDVAVDVDPREITNSTSWNHWIPRTRLLPNRSNNKWKEIEDNHRQRGKNSATNTTSAAAAAATTKSTPHYTNSLAEDLHLLATTHLINSTLCALSTSSSLSIMNDSSSFHETLLLLKVWALQRGFLRGHDTFTTTTLAVLLVYLYRTKAIGKRMGCIQAFTTFMKFWSENDWLGEDVPISTRTQPAVGVRDLKTTNNPITVHEQKARKKSAFVIPHVGRSESQTIAECVQARSYLDDIHENNTVDYSEGHGTHALSKTLLDCYRVNYTSSSTCSMSVHNDCHHDSPILLDPTMTLNYLARLSPSFVRESRAEAHMALRYIHGLDIEGNEGGGGWAFRKLFLETNRFWTRYDAYVRVPLSVVPRVSSACDSGGAGKRKHHGQGNSTSAKRVWGNDVDDIGYDESVCRSLVEVIFRALGDRATSIRPLTSGNGSIHEYTSTVDVNDEEVATNIIDDCDQNPRVPIRGHTVHTLGYSARSGDRSPRSPVLCVSDCASGAHVIVGLRLDSNTSRRIVDRGPPAEDVQGSDAFVTLWGEKHAQLRRFQDGAIVRAVVWNNPSSTTELVQFSGSDRSLGGIVERIIQHVIKLHFTDEKLAKVMKESTHNMAFQLRDMISLIDGASSLQSSPVSDSLALHKNIMNAFDAFADFLRLNSKPSNDNVAAKGKNSSNLGLPLAIDSVEPLSPCLRYSALFPPVPHPLLGGEHSVVGSDKRKVSGVNVGSPILIQIRFEGSSKWPTSLNAMGAAKCAMLLQLADGIERMKQNRGNILDNDLDSFDGPIDVTPTYLDIGYRGYSWRIIVRADQELRMLRTLRNPTDDANALRSGLINLHVRGAMHHSLVHAVYTRHPSASSVVRLALRWVASHMMSDMITHETIELIVVKVYMEPTGKLNSFVNAPPSTAVAGFIKFLHLISTHDWAREPLIVDPQNHISSHDRAIIYSQFMRVRGPEWNRGSAMYIISPTDYDSVEDMEVSKVIGDDDNAKQVNPPVNTIEKVWVPNASFKVPEKVVLNRAAALAKRSYDHLTAFIAHGNTGNSWIAAFQENSQSLSSFSALLRVRPCFVSDLGCSSTNADFSIGTTDSFLGQSATPFERSLQNRVLGPKELQKKLYKNLVLERDTVHHWDPVRTLVNTLRSEYNQYALFFYNEFAPEIIAMVWRPDAFKPHAFSVGASTLKRPVEDVWKEDSFVVTNAEDLLAEVGYLARNIVSNVKIFDEKKS